MDLQAAHTLSRTEAERLLSEARAGTLRLVEALDDDDLRRQHSPLMSPIVWDLGHIAHFEEVWLLENIEGAGPGSEGLRGMYDPFRNPRASREALPLPRRADAERDLAEVRSAVLDRLSQLDLDHADTPLLRNGYVIRMVLQHEYQHNETILQTLQLKQGTPCALPHRVPLPQPATNASPAGTMVRVPGGEVVIGTDDRSEAYDNERPRHVRAVGDFEIDVYPVTNGQYLDFMADGGYRRPELWHPEGWAWLQGEGYDAPRYWSATATGWVRRSFDQLHDVRADQPVCHVSWWEADAWARWAGKRLPTEFEWEVAALRDPSTGETRRFPWGDDAATSRHANLDARLGEPALIGTLPEGVSAAGCHQMIGDVWEWTSSHFAPYPGYETFPYPEYSEVFFGTEYRVLRGGSWATRPGAVRGTFRNWDYPIRSQLFAGFRCARDV